MSLILDLVRHGDALAAERGGDAARPLSPRGRADVQRLADQLARELARWDRVYASPLDRARETAGLLLDGRKGLPKPELAEWLAPDADADEVIEALELRQVSRGAVLLVSHQPLIGHLALHLAGQLVNFRPGSFHRIEFDAQPGRGNGHLTRSIHPES